MSGSMTGGVDSSIPLQAKVPPPINPLAQIGEFANIQNALNQAKFVPGALQLQQQSIQRSQTDTSQLLNRAAYQSLTPLLNKEGPITIGDVTGTLASVEHNLNVPTHGIIQHIIDSGTSGAGFDPWIRNQILTQTQPPETAAASALPRPGVIDNGQILQPTLTTAPGLRGQGTVNPAGQGYTKGLAPEFLAQQVGRQATAAEAATLGVPPGTPLTEPMATRLFGQGVPLNAGRATIGGTGAYPGPMTTQPPPMPSGAAPTSPANPNNQAIPTAPGPTITGPAPSAQREFEASADQYNQASAAANSFRTRTFALEQAAHALENADTGPGSETVNHMKSFLLAQSPESLKKYLPGIDPNKIQNYDEAVKYLAQYSRNQPGAANSDMQSQLAQTANASTHISQAAAQQVVQNTLGLERMNQAALSEFNATHPEGSGQQFSRWLTGDFLPNQDPRGFAWDDMSASQRAASLKVMSSTEKSRLLNSVRLARQSGFRSGP